jgi:hypothetical protein
MENNELGNLEQILEDEIRSKTEIEWMYAFGKLIRYIKYSNDNESPENTKDILYDLLYNNYLAMKDENKEDKEIFLSFRTGYKTLDLHMGDKSITGHILNDILKDGKPFKFDELSTIGIPTGELSVFVTGLCSIYPAALNMISIFDEETTKELINFRHYYMIEIYDITGNDLNPIIRKGAYHY